MDAARLCAWRAHLQGLDGSLNGSSSADVLARTGWARSVGGANPYLSLFARNGSSRADVDGDVAQLKIHELPAARGCTYVLPAEHFGLGLALGAGNGESADLRVAKQHLGVTPEELDLLKKGVLKALRSGPVEPAEIKKTLGDLVRSLGEEGKKRGQTTTLPLALGSLQTEGKIRRVPVNGRLDQQRYKYAAWDAPPELPADRAAIGSALAALFWRWSGAASLEQFKVFSGFSVAAVKEAVGALKLSEFEGDPALLATPEAKASYQAFESPDEPCYSLVGSMDSYLLLRRDANMCLDAAAAKIPQYTEKGERVGSLLSEVSCNAILDRGRIVGLWEYDPAAGELVWVSFREKSPELEAAVARMEEFVKSDLEDCRSFSLDSPESRKPKLAWLRSRS